MYTYEELLNIIKTLRGPEGCPWDRKQTHDSLKACMMEEAAEVVSAIRIYHKTGDSENLQEELGDVLLQVVLHAQIAQEEGLFTIEDVVNHVAEKMVRRHPHVFAQKPADSTEQHYAEWEEIKKREKEGKSYIESPLREIPMELPSLSRAPKILKRVDKLYEQQPSYDQAIKELERAVNKLKQCQTESEEAQRMEAVGDALISLSQIARISRIPQEQVLMDRIEDIIEKYEQEKDKE